MSEEMIVKYCSPTLAGLKTGNMFTVSFSSIDQLRRDIRAFNRRLVSRGLRVIPLRVGRKALIYVYRPDMLASDLAEELAVTLLNEMGYTESTPEKCIVRLISRFEQADFPHEVGLFLGYPAEDVCGFIKNKADGFKRVGSWKVYGDEERAEKTFADFKNCTESYLAMHKGGCALENLAIAI